MAEDIVILHLEDNPYDAELVKFKVEESNPHAEIYWVSDKSNFKENLKREQFDLILSDYDVPDFLGMEALEIVRQIDPFVPFIYVTGQLGEKVVVEVLIAGATDYVLKDNLEKLPLSIKRAYKEYQQKLENKRYFESLKLRNMAIEQAGVGVIITDVSRKDSPTIFINKRVEEITGYNETDFIGRNPKFLQGPGTDQNVVKQMAESIANNEVFSCEIQNYHKEGHVFWIHMTIAPIIREHEREPSLFVGVMKDITEKKLLEEEIVETNKLFEEIQEVARIGLWNYSTKNELIYLSTDVAKLFGEDEDMFLELKEFRKYIHPEYFEKLVTSLNMSQIENEKWDIDLLISDANSEERWLRMIGYAAKKTETETLIRGLIMDNHEKKMAEINAIESNIFSELIFNSVLDVLCLHQPDGICIRVSPSVFDITGYQPEEVIGKNPVELVHPDDRNVFSSKYVRGLFDSSKSQVEYRIKHKKGHYIWLLTSSVSVLDKNGKIEKIVTSSVDITEQKSSTIELAKKHKEALKFQSMLLSTQINPHFIFNSLNAIQYYILDQDIEKAINFISDFSTLMRAVLNNSMRNYITIENEVIWLEKYLTLEQARFSDKFKFKIIVDKKIDLQEDIVPTMLLQPFVENAILHGVGPIEEGGMIKIEFKKVKKNIICQVEDNGVGRETKNNVEQKMQKEQRRKSYGVKITRSKIELLNELEDGIFDYHVMDKKDEDGNPTGTKIVISYPENLSS